MTRRRTRTFKRQRLLLLLFLAVLVVLFVRAEWIGRMIYPVYYTAEITRHAAANEVDPLLIAAIIRVESNFRADAVSPKGALGIMQVMPDTAEWILQKGAFGGLTVEDVSKSADAGIQLGTWYVRELNRQFGGSLPLTLAAYNAGPSRVRKWLDEGVWDGHLETIRNIPFGETRHYVQRVLYYYEKYREIYGDDLQKRT
jgi:soluble lytic murein transglycosylase